MKTPSSLSHDILLANRVGGLAEPGHRPSEIAPQPLARARGGPPLSSKVCDMSKCLICGSQAQADYTLSYISWSYELKWSDLLIYQFSSQPSFLCAFASHDLRAPHPPLQEDHPRNGKWFITILYTRIYIFIYKWIIYIYISISINICIYIYI